MSNSAVAESLPPQTDRTKLVSLLALATGAVALPQTSQADIIYTNMSSSPVVVGYTGDASFLFNLPDTTAQVGFERRPYGTTFPITLYTCRVVAGKIGGADAAAIRGNGGFAAPLAYGAAWNQGGGSFLDVAVGSANTFNRNPTSGYDHQYLAWRFYDSVAGANRFGWVEISLNIATLLPGNGPNVTIWGYAYDNTGAQPTMGQGVPEPTSGALLVLGALALGARGVRQWRQPRAGVGKS